MASNLRPVLLVNPLRWTEPPSRSMRTVLSVRCLPAMVPKSFHPHPPVSFQWPCMSFSLTLLEHCHTVPVFRTG